MTRRLLLIRCALLCTVELFVPLTASIGMTGASCVPPPPGLVSWWTGDADTMDIVSGNNGTLENGATFAPGIVRDAFSFDGIDSFVRVEDSPNLRLGTGEITLDAWIQAPPGNTFRAIVAKLDVSFPFPGYALRITDDNRVDFFAVDCATGSCGFGNSRLPLRSASMVADNSFHHVAGVRRSDGTIEIYVDGLLENSRMDPLWNTDSSDPLTIGEIDFLGPEQQFEGLIDEVELFNVALSASDVQALFNAGSAGKCRELRFRLPFEGTEDITQGPGCGNHHGPQSEAIDYALTLEPVYASERGKVIYADWHSFDPATGSPAVKARFGRVVEVEHPDGSITIYAHLDSSAVSKGEEVSRGQLLGRSGNTGHVKSNDGRMGYHLHFERRVSAVDRGDGYRSGGIGVPISDLPATSLTGCSGTATFQE